MHSRHAVRSLISGALLTIATISLAFAEGSFDIPAGAHFNQQKLQRIGEFFRGEIANGKIPGAILLIQQHGKPVYHEFFGVRDVATELPMTDDTIFRLYSMSKPITSVAAMMLVDEGGSGSTIPLPNTFHHSLEPRWGWKRMTIVAGRRWSWCR